MTLPRTKAILKWAGGKFRLLDFLLPSFPRGERLIEPFVGSGAVFMNTDYPSYLLADINPDLIDFYLALRDGRDAFIDRCQGLFAAANNREDAYYRHRERFNLIPPGPEKAALFLYLNRHGYNGLVRYNAGGGFNVPFGRYARPYFPGPEMLAFAEKTRSRQVEFLVADFRATFARVDDGDVVYCDPPYIPLSVTANFTGYAGNAFGPEEQAGLATAAEAASARGATIAISNHDVRSARDLYHNASRIRSASVRRLISCNGGKREVAEELLAVYDPFSPVKTDGAKPK